MQAQTTMPTSAAPTMGAPWISQPVPLFPSPQGGTTMTEATDQPAANWLIHESSRKHIRIRLTEKELVLDDEHMLADDVTNVAFWSERSSHHEFVLMTPDTKLTFCLRDHRIDFVPSATDFVAVVRYLEDAVVPRLVQQRMQRIDMGLAVAVGPTQLDRAGIHRGRGKRRKTLAWADFDHITIHRDHLTIVGRRGRKLDSFTNVRLNLLDAVLLPKLLSPAASVFRNDNR
jgi:hypothetical protein